jgi:hypothetical protein
MQRFQIIPGKNRTIHSLLKSEFPPIKSTNNKPTPYVTPKTIGYIHGLICDSITLFHSDACNAKALSNENMILEILEAKEPAVFRQQLFNTLVHYYEEILCMPGAGGRPKPQSFKRKMRDEEPQPAAAVAAAVSDSAEAAADGPHAQQLPVGGGGEAEAPAAAAAAAGQAAGRRGKSGARA